MFTYASPLPRPIPFLFAVVWGVGGTIAGAAWFGWSECTVCADADMHIDINSKAQVATNKPFVGAVVQLSVLV